MCDCKIYCQDTGNGDCRYMVKCSKGTPKSDFEHVPMKAAIDDTVYCIRCGRELGLAN